MAFERTRTKKRIPISDLKGAYEGFDLVQEDVIVTLEFDAEGSRVRGVSDILFHLMPLYDANREDLIKYRQRLWDGAEC